MVEIGPQVFFAVGIERKWSGPWYGWSPNVAKKLISPC